MTATPFNFRRALNYIQGLPYEDITTMRIIGGILLIILLSATTGYGLAIRLSKWHTPGNLALNTTRFLSVLPRSKELNNTGTHYDKQKEIDDAVKAGHLADKIDSLDDRINNLIADNKLMHDDIASLTNENHRISSHLDIDEARYGTYLTVLGSLFTIFIAPVVVASLKSKYISSEMKSPNRQLTPVQKFPPPNNNC